jgi:hypothetical protein
VRLLLGQNLITSCQLHLVRTLANNMQLAMACSSYDYVRCVPKWTKSPDTSTRECCASHDYLPALCAHEGCVFRPKQLKRSQSPEETPSMNTSPYLIRFTMDPSHFTIPTTLPFCNAELLPKFESYTQHLNNQCQVTPQTPHGVQSCKAPTNLNVDTPTWSVNSLHCCLRFVYERCV